MGFGIGFRGFDRGFGEKWRGRGGGGGGGVKSGKRFEKKK